jgi:hypothetical protein
MLVLGSDEKTRWLADAIGRDVGDVVDVGVETGS